MITSKFHLGGYFTIFWKEYDRGPEWEEFDLSEKCNKHTYLNIRDDIQIPSDARITLYVDKKLSRLLESMEWSIVLYDDRRLLEVKGSEDDMMIFRLSSDLIKYPD